MNESIFLTSSFSNHRRGSKSLTSAAICVENCVASKRVILVTPLRPSHKPLQVSSVPVPSAGTKPTPVTTTLRFCKCNLLQPLLLGFRQMRLDVVDRIFDCRNFFGVFVGNVHSKTFFKS